MNADENHEMTVHGDIGRAGTSSPQVRSLWLAFALSIAFLVVSALQSAHSFYSRIVGSSMMAATRAAWTGQAARDVALFVVAQLFLHLAFGLLAWSLAW